MSSAPLPFTRRHGFAFDLKIPSAAFVFTVYSSGKSLRRVRLEVGFAQGPSSASFKTRPSACGKATPLSAANVGAMSAGEAGCRYSPFRTPRP
jgi:hypothetical protein